MCEKRYFYRGGSRWLHGPSVGGTAGSFGNRHRRTTSVVTTVVKFNFSPLNKIKILQGTFPGAWDRQRNGVVRYSARNEYVPVLRRLYAPPHRYPGKYCGSGMKAKSTYRFERPGEREMPFDWFRAAKISEWRCACTLFSTVSPPTSLVFFDTMMIIYSHPPACTYYICMCVCIVIKSRDF